MFNFRPVIILLNYIASNRGDLSSHILMKNINLMTVCGAGKLNNDSLNDIIGVNIFLVYQCYVCLDVT